MGEQEKAGGIYLEVGSGTQIFSLHLVISQLHDDVPWKIKMKNEAQLEPVAMRWGATRCRYSVRLSPVQGNVLAVFKGKLPSRAKRGGRCF